MLRPPIVVFIARTHALVSVVILASVVVLHVVVSRLPRLEVEPKAYAVTLGLAGLYALAAAAVWQGWRGAGFLSRLCGLIYLVRPGLGDLVWTGLRSPEFRDWCSARGRLDP
jgi:hypothetical protein